MKRLLITIDGPAGAGKTTVSRTLADRLGYKYIDTGALYRGVAYEAKSRKIAHDDDNGLEKLCAGLDLKFVRQKNRLRLYSGNADITDLIRTPEISMLASAVSARPVVRKYLLSLQRGLGKKKGVIFEGRDMMTFHSPWGPSTGSPSISSMALPPCGPCSGTCLTPACIPTPWKRPLPRITIGSCSPSICPKLTWLLPSGPTSRPMPPPQPPSSRCNAGMHQARIS